MAHLRAFGVWTRRIMTGIELMPPVLMTSLKKHGKHLYQACVLSP
jgi:hypothetical protein